jgi:DNA polymerase II large subunit
MNLQQSNPENLRTGKIGERDLRAYFNLQYTFLHSITLAREAALRSYGPVIDMPVEPQKDRTTEVKAVKEDATQTSEPVKTYPNVEQPTAPNEPQRVPEKLASSLASSAVHASETAENSSNPDIDEIREKVDRALNAAKTPLSPPDDKNNYDVAA